MKDKAPLVIMPPLLTTTPHPGPRLWKGTWTRIGCIIPEKDMGMIQIML